jgi:hypothetical protein
MIYWPDLAIIYYCYGRSRTSYYNNYIQYIAPLVIDLGLLSVLLIPHHDLMPLDT